MTTWLKVKNNAASELATAITAIATELTLKTGEGSRFPASFPYHITINDEIMEVTARIDDTLTVTRAQESTSPASHNSGSAVRLNITAALIDELQTEIDTKETALPLTTKGDLLVFASALARLGVGSNGQYLVADSGESAGVKWQSLSGGTQIAGGTYTGNGATNRAIPHGLGVTPKIIFFLDQNEYMFSVFFTTLGKFLTHGQNTGISFYPYGGTYKDVTDPDSTNFYVGCASYTEMTANKNSSTIHWVAIG